MNKLGARAAMAAIVMALVLLAGMAGFAWQGAAQLAADGNELSRTHRVLTLLAMLQASALEAESAQRGHALSGDPALLEGFGRAKDNINTRLADLRTTDAASAERYERLVALGALLAQRLEGLGKAIELRGRGGPVAALQWEATGEGRRVDERLRAVFAELQRHAEAERQQLQRSGEASARRAQGGAIACGLAAVGVAGLALWQLWGTGRALLRAREERVGAVEGHQRASSEWARLFELAPDAVCLLDAEGRVTRVSPAGEKLWGWADTDLIGKPALDMTAPDDQRKTGQALATVMASAAAHTFRNRWRRKDGSLVYLAWALQWSAADGNLLCVARDITELERLRLAVSRQTQALNLGSTELKQAVERADAAQSLQAVFVAAVGQALRPPAEAVLARSAQMMQDRSTAAEPAQRQSWALVHDQADALQEAISDVLDCGAVEAGQVAIKKEAFDVWELLNQAANATRSRAERKGLEFRLSLAEDLGYARGDTRRVEQVLRKLLHEAVTATDAGTVALHAARQRDGMVRIEVHDDAIVPGDPAELFSPPATNADPAAPLAQARPVASVALVLSRRLARLMGGDLVASKGAAQGRVFVLTLPADDMGAAA